jgi:hypothetical protein
MTERALAVQPCSRCDRPIDRCEFCDAADCRTPICATQEVGRPDSVLASRTAKPASLGHRARRLAHSRPAG